jgi:hypothetical protein
MVSTADPASTEALELGVNVLSHSAWRRRICILSNACVYAGNIVL